MVWHKRQLTAGLCLVLMAGSLSVPATAAIYRYVDENGRTVFASSMPQKYAGNGYTILNDRGQVVEVVPPAPSATDLVERQAEEARRLAQEQAEREQTEADNLLLRLYREPEDIWRRRDERLMQLDSQIALVTTTLNETLEEIERVELVVAGHQLRNEEVPQRTLQELENAENSKAESEQRLATLEGSRAEIMATAEREEARLRELLNIPE